MPAFSSRDGVREGRERGGTIHHVYGLPDDSIHSGYASRVKPGGLTDEDCDKIAEHVRSLVRQAQDLGLTYEDWFAELGDEPGEGNSPSCWVAARTVSGSAERVLT